MSGIGTGVDFFVNPEAIESSPIALIVTVANTIQHDRLKNLPTDLTDHPFSIQADDTTWTEFDETVTYDAEAGQIEGFNVGIGKKVFITPLK